MTLDVPSPDSSPLVAAVPASGGISLVLVVISVGFAVAGQVTLKKAMTEIGRIGSAEVSATTQTIFRAAREPWLWIGLALFGISALFWLVVLSRVPLSVAYPFVGMSYIVVVALSRVLLNEHVPTLRWVGVVIVAVGIAVIGFSFRSPSGGG